ncbi:MAG: hypothetical protein ABEH43_10315 [Flavobacteriales bacterium]
MSLATFKPTTIEGLEIEEDEREWKDEWKELRKQGDLFTGKKPEIQIPKLPYKFKYKFKDEVGNTSKLMIEDWEIGQLYWNCLKNTGGNEKKRLKRCVNAMKKNSSTKRIYISFWEQQNNGIRDEQLILL